MRDRTLFFFIAVYLAQGLIGVAYEPIYFLQKDVLGLGVRESGLFAAAMTLPFLFKPVLGIITDAFPLGKRRRLPYLFLTALATAAGWGALALLPNYTFLNTVLLLIVVHIGISFVDVLCDGVMVERGKRLKKTGDYQSVQIGTLYLMLFVSGVGGGWLAEHASYRAIFGLTACFPLLILASLWAVEEAPLKEDAQSPKRLAEGLLSLARKPVFWAACAIILLFNFKPYQGTARFYYQADTLGFSKILIGSLTSIDGMSGVAGAGLYWWLLNRKVRLGGRTVTLTTANLVRATVVLGAPLSLVWIGYRTPLTAGIITAVFGFLGVAMRLSLMDLVAQACPEHGEATAFALFMSVFNLAAWSSNTTGAYAYGALGDAYGAHGTMAVLIVFGALCTALCWPLLRYIDGGIPNETENRQSA
jgi:MFS family permease